MRLHYQSNTMRFLTSSVSPAYLQASNPSLQWHQEWLIALWDLGVVEAPAGWQRVCMRRKLCRLAVALREVGLQADRASWVGAKWHEALKITKGNDGREGQPITGLLMESEAWVEDYRRKKKGLRGKTLPACERDWRWDPPYLRGALITLIWGGPLV